MKRGTVRTGVLAVMFLAMAVAPAAANDNQDNKISAHLVGYRETPLTINSNGSAEFKATISQDGTPITYTMTYRPEPAGRESFAKDVAGAQAGLSTNQLAELRTSFSGECPEHKLSPAGQICSSHTLARLGAGTITHQ